MILFSPRGKVSGPNIGICPEHIKIKRFGFKGIIDFIFRFIPKMLPVVSQAAFSFSLWPNSKTTAIKPFRTKHYSVFSSRKTSYHYYVSFIKLLSGINNVFWQLFRISSFVLYANHLIKNVEVFLKCMSFFRDKDIWTAI